MGAKKRCELHGPIIGTYESQRRGGLNSIKTHKENNTGFFLLKAINIPARCSKLAELIGVLLGDGSISLRQVRIYLNPKKDKPYANYLRNTIKELFGIEVSSSERVAESTLVLTMNSTKLVHFLNKQSLPVGDKIKQGIRVPDWIWDHKEWQRACLRGLFDTDGCTYIDLHKYKNKIYGHACIAFTSDSKNLLQDIHRSLINLGYTPTISIRRNILLRRENEVFRFFKDIKPNNEAHFDIIRRFVEEYRSGRNGAASKADGDESPTGVRISPPPPVRKCLCWLALCEGLASRF